MALDQGIVDSVADVNIKNLGDQPAFYSGLAMRGAVEAANGFSALMQSVVAKSAKYVIEEDANEAVSVQKLMSDGVAQQLSQLLAALGGGQIATKAAQTTPPVSAPEPVK